MKLCMNARERKSTIVELRDTSGRRQQISAMLKDFGSVQVLSLSQKFSVSTQTIRKDLEFLEQRGIAERSYGGAISKEAITAPREPAVELKRSINVREKQLIGQRAAAMVNPGDSIVLDSGTTAIEIARNLPDDEDITVLTNDFGVLSILAQKDAIRIFLLGGELRRKNLAFYGANTVNALNDLHVDKLFLGVDGFDHAGGITTHHEPEAILNRKMTQAAGKVIAVTDSSKFGRICLHKIIGLNDLSALVTDSNAPDFVHEAGEECEFDVIVA